MFIDDNRGPSSPVGSDGSFPKTYHHTNLWKQKTPALASVSIVAYQGPFVNEKARFFTKISPVFYESKVANLPKNVYARRVTFSLQRNRTRH